MMRRFVIVLVGILCAVLARTASGQARHYALETTEGLQLHNTTAEAVTFQGKRGVRVAVAPEVMRRPEYISGQIEPESFVRIEGLELSNGVIEVEVAGSPAEGAFAGARGFVGIAFRVQADSTPNGRQTYDAFYLRPTNGRAEDQERRNHSVARRRRATKRTSISCRIRGRRSRLKYGVCRPGYTCMISHSRC